MTLEEILKYAYDNETNIQINSFWDDGYEVKIGDEMNGYSHFENFDTNGICEIADWIEISLKDRYEQIKNGKLALI
jgi:hypothetical protein